MGMKTKSKESLVTGLMWMRQDRKFPLKKLRHNCEHGLFNYIQINQNIKYCEILLHLVA